MVQAVRPLIAKGPEVAGRAYNLATREMVSLRELVERSARLLDREVEIVGLPSELLAAAGIDPEALSPLSTLGQPPAVSLRAVGFEPVFGLQTNLRYCAHGG